MPYFLGYSIMHIADIYMFLCYLERTFQYYWLYKYIVQKERKLW